MVVGVVVVAVIVVAVIVLLDQGRTGPGAGDEAGALDKSLGAADAPVVVMEYADFQCPYCKLFAEGPGRQLKTDYVESGQVRFVFRHLAFLGNESVWAAEAAECAEEQDRFWDYHDKLFEEQGAENSGALAMDNLKRFAVDLGLDTARFDECLDSHRYRDQVQAERAEAERRRINATPTLLVNGQLIQGGASYPVLRAAIESALGQ
jgi:protein-disulfide isomerase